MKVHSLLTFLLYGCSVVSGTVHQMEGDNALIPCELTAENSSYIKDFILIWKAIKNASTSVLASFNKTSGITRFFEKRLSLDTAKPYHLHINGLTLHDQGDYLCNVSTPQYTQLTITTLQVEKRTRTNTKLVVMLTSSVVTVVSFVAVITAIYCLPKKRHTNQNRSERNSLPP
ncbi:HERV-H LTR-associating protein 2 [Alligator mississippiensis]|uniref:HERV-H LTR-associating protein 2 n=1 Tax=Alligator mississippiensis TaxID=8496 RepID=A0A151MDB2_ALLMI|nr:HERV-H LTR-associating protein 2 [Alligator mississippiensis]